MLIVSIPSNWHLHSSSLFILTRVPTRKKYRLLCYNLRSNSGWLPIRCAYFILFVCSITWWTSTKIVIPRRSRRDIVLASSVRPSIPSVRTFCLSGTISQYLLVRFNSFLVQMISTMNSRYPISLVKIGPLTLELLPLFKYRQLKGKTYISFFVWWSSHFIKAIIVNNFSL